MGIINPFAQRTTTNVDEDGPKVRILACKVCKTLDVMGDYTGPRERAAEFDVELMVMTERHQGHVGQLFDAPASAWNDPTKQAEIRKRLVAQFDPNAESGLGAEAYALRDTFKEDAFACWEQHRRTPTCSDYKSDAKRLVPDTASERKEAGITKFDINNPATQRFLCEYCPVHSLVVDAARRKAGLA